MEKMATFEPSVGAAIGTIFFFEAITINKNRIKTRRLFIGAEPRVRTR